MAYGERSDPYARREYPYPSNRGGKDASARPRYAQEHRPRDRHGGDPRDKPGRNLPAKPCHNGNGYDASSPVRTEAPASQQEPLTLSRAPIAILRRGVELIEACIQGKRDLDRLDQLLRKKKDELRRSRQTEFSAAPEMIKKALANLEQERAKVDNHIKLSEQELEKLYEQVAKQILQVGASHVPLEKPSQEKPPLEKSAPETPSQEKPPQDPARSSLGIEVSKLNAQAKTFVIDISDLKSQVGKLKSKDQPTPESVSSPEVSELKAKLETVMQESKAKSATIDELKGLVGTALQENKTNTTAIDELRGLVKTVKEDSEAKTAAIDELKDLVKTLKEEREMLKEESKAKTTAINELKGLVKTANEENGVKTTAADDLKGLVKTLEGDVQTQRERFEILERTVTRHTENLEEVDTTLKSHSEVVMEVDIPNLSQAADFFAFEKPIMEEEIKKQREELEVVKGEASQATATATQALNGQDGIIDAFGAMVDDLRKTTKELEDRVGVIDSKNQITPAAQPAVEGAALGRLNRKVDDLSSKVEHQRQDLTTRLGALDLNLKATRASIDTVDREAKERDKALEQSVNQQRQHVDARCDSLSLLYENLDARLNNTTTRELFQQIVGHMERVYPSQRQIQIDVEQVMTKQEQQESTLQTVLRKSPGEGEVKALREEVQQLKDVVKYQSNSMIKMETGGSVAAYKKRKLEELNGVARTNGHSPSEAVVVTTPS